MKAIFIVLQDKTKSKANINNFLKSKKEVFFDVVDENKYEYDGLTEVETSDVLNTAYEYVQYEKSDKIIERKEYRERVFAILKKRKIW